jgi:hypothetical protein
VRSLFLFVLLLGCPSAWCKCVTTYYAVTGRVLSSAGQPIAGVNLTVEAQANNFERVATVTASDGMYKLEIPFNAYSGRSLITGGDLCGAVISEIRVSAARAGVTNRKVVHVSAANTVVDWIFD